MNKNLKFILRVTGIHILTYILCGIIFSSIFTYDSLFAIDGVSDFMKEVGGTSTLLGPLVQVIRGLLFGLVLLLVKDSFVGKRLGWLKLWLLIAIIGIINTPGPAPFSIEGIIYTKLPLEFHLKGVPEILIQTLLFSYFVTKAPSINQNKFIEKNKPSFIAATISAVLFSLSGIILALILNVDITASISDIGAFFIMFIAVTTIFILSKNYNAINLSYRNAVTFILSYLVLAIFPFLYNKFTGSPFDSYLTLGINLISTIIVFYIIKANNSISNKSKILT